MASRNDSRPIVIKRKKVVVSNAHHGGAWKVAYADFVTAMMAFFLMLWLLGSTTSDQRKGLADYFTPTVTVLRTPAGGDGMMGGGTPGTESRMGGDSGDQPPVAEHMQADTDDGGVAPQPTLESIEAFLHGASSESEDHRVALRQMITRITDQGLTIELFDHDDSPLFLDGGDQPTPTLVLLAGLINQAFARVSNPVAIEAHVRAHAVVERDTRIWDLSTDRALAMRRLLADGGLDEQRLRRLTGHGDRTAVDGNPMSMRNNRIVLTLLRGG